MRASRAASRILILQRHSRQRRAVVVIPGPRLHIGSDKQARGRPQGVDQRRIGDLDGIIIAQSGDRIEEGVVEGGVKAEDVRYLMDDGGRDRLEEQVGERAGLVHQTVGIDDYPAHRWPALLQRVVRGRVTRHNRHPIARFSSCAVADVFVGQVPREDEQVVIGDRPARVVRREVHAGVGNGDGGELASPESLLVEVLSDHKRVEDEVQVGRGCGACAIESGCDRRCHQVRIVQVNPELAVLTGGGRHQQPAIEMHSRLDQRHLRHVVLGQMPDVLVVLIEEALVGVDVSEGQREQQNEQLAYFHWVCFILNHNNSYHHSMSCIVSSWFSYTLCWQSWAGGSAGCADTIPLILWQNSQARRMLLPKTLTATAAIWMQAGTQIWLASVTLPLASMRQQKLTKRMSTWTE